MYDSGEAAGALRYTMPYVEGESLAERLRRETRLDVDDAVSLAREVAEALDCAHAAGVRRASSGQGRQHSVVWNRLLRQRGLEGRAANAGPLALGGASPVPLEWSVASIP